MRKLFSILLFALLTTLLTAQVSKTINVTTAGMLNSLLTSTEKSTITNLTVTGNIDQRDVLTMRDNMPLLAVLDISAANIKAYSSYPDNEMPSYSFYNYSTYISKTTLTTVILPASVTSIGTEAFRSCTGISSITFPTSLTSIGSTAFFNCRGITSLTLPSSLTTIGVSAFESCRGITSLILPSSLKTLSSYAFSACTGINFITSLNPVPPSVGTLALQNVVPSKVYVPALVVSTYKAASGWSALNIVAVEKRVTIYNPTAGGLAGALVSGGYSPLSSITHLTVTGNLNSIDLLQMKTSLIALTEVDLSGTNIVGNAIPANAFQSITTLEAVNLPSTITSIGDYAFDGCTKLGGSIPLPTAVMSIGNYAYQNCSSLSGSLTIPSAVTAIGTSVFSGCSNLTGPLILPNAITSLGASSFYGCSGFTGSLTIPNGVTSIGTSAFSACSGLNGSLTIPNTVTSIGSSAFSACMGFTSLSIGSGVNSIGDNAFLGCTNLSGVLHIPGNVTSIGISAFQNCTGFKNSLTIDEGVRTIGSSAFSGCSGFTGILTLPITITSIGASSFLNCTGFTGTITLPNAITTVPSSAFSGCSGFTGALTIPLSVTSIAASAFKGCSKLTELYFSKTTTTTIADNAFNGCTGLTKISIPRYTPPTIYTNTFGSVNKESCTLEVPTGSSFSYQTANYWNQFIFVTESTMADTYSITIQFGTNGVVKENNVSLGNGTILTVDGATTKTFSFVPAVGYAVATLTFGGVDVKSQLVNNQYTTPSVNANATLSVTFSKVQYRLSIKSAETGTANILCEYGASFNLDFTPATNWKVSTVFYNNVDVTSSLINGVYTVPAITANSLLNVAFVSISVGAPELMNNRVKVYSTNSEIIVDGTSLGETVTLYTVNGKQIQTVMSKGEILNFQVDRDAVYLVRAGEKTFKVIL